MLILEDENSRFSGRQVILPQDLVNHLRQQQNTYSGDNYKTSKGYKRLNALLSKDYNDPTNKKATQHNQNHTISFADVKRIDFDIRHMTQNEENPEYAMIGGDMMRDFVHNTLSSFRNSVSQVKPVPEVPKLQVKDVKPDRPQKVVKVGKREVTIENQIFNKNIRQMFNGSY